MKIIYYTSTILLSLGMLFGAYADLAQTPDAVAILAHLGYPAYLLLILGAAKVLGVIGIWQNKVPFLREWAYAGFVFDTGGGLVSHLAVGDGPAEYGAALAFLIVTLVSYISLRKARTA